MTFAKNAKNIVENISVNTQLNEKMVILYEYQITINGLQENIQITKIRENLKFLLKSSNHPCIYTYRNISHIG